LVCFNVFTSLITRTHSFPRKILPNYTAQFSKFRGSPHVSALGSRVAWTAARNNEQTNEQTNERACHLMQVIQVQGQSRSAELPLFDRPFITSYYYQYYKDFILYCFPNTTAFTVSK